MYALGSAWLTKERDVMDKVGHPTQITNSDALKHFQVRAFLPTGPPPPPWASRAACRGAGGAGGG